MKTSKMIAMALTVAMASQMMVPMAFGAEAEGLNFVDVVEDIAGEGYAFAYAEAGSTLTITDDVVIQDVNGIILPADATLVVEEDASLTIGAETFGICADGDMDLVIDGDMTIIVGMEGATEMDPLYAILAAGTLNDEGVYSGDGNLTITADGNVDIVARDGIYSSGDMNITGGNWEMMAYIALSSNTSDITLEDGSWNIVGDTGISVLGGDATIANCEFYGNMMYAISVAEGTMTIGDGCVVASDGVFVGADIAVSENADVNAMISYSTVVNDGSELPWTVMVCGDVVFTHMTGENTLYNDHIVFEEGATLTITEDAFFTLAPSEDKEGDLGSTMDATGGTIINNGIMIFNAGTTEEEIEAMDIQGDGAVGVMSEEELLSLPYTDVSTSNWFYDAVFFVTGFGFMEGISETEFAPTEAMTRGMLMDSMYHVSGAYMEEGADGDAVAWAIEAGISDGTNPENPVTRQEMVSILYRAIGSPVGDGDLSSFADGDDISDYAVDAMVWAVEAGLVSGNPDGTLGARDGATRAQMAQILLKLVQLMYGM